MEYRDFFIFLAFILLSGLFLFAVIIGQTYLSTTALEEWKEGGTRTFKTYISKHDTIDSN